MNEQETLATCRRAEANANRIAAIVVAFAPNESQINMLIRVLVRQCETVYVMDNGGGSAVISRSPETHAALQIIDMGGNCGVGDALNRGFRLAAASDVDYVTTFDQDSEPGDGQIAALVAALEELKSVGENVAAVGPRIVDLRGATRLDYPFMRRTMGWPMATRCTAAAKYIEADFLITSGSVIAVAAYAAVGEFDGGLFVDYTDVDWCLRAQSQGYRLFGVCSVTMPHELGTGHSATILGLTVLGSKPVRRYYYARNAVLLCKCSYVATGWKTRLVIGIFGRLLLMPFAERFSPGWTKSWLMLFRGLSDGIKGTKGAYARSA